MKDPLIHITFSPRNDRVPWVPGATLRDVIPDPEWLSSGAACNGRGDCGLCQIRIIEGEVTAPTPVEMRRLSRAQIEQHIRLACQTIPLTDLKVSLEKPVVDCRWREIDDSEYSPFRVLQGGAGAGIPVAAPGRFGVAVDLGSSHIRLSLWDMNTGRRMATRTGLNPQLSYGTDVLTRLAAAESSPADGARLSRLVEHAIGEALRNMTDAESVRTQDIGHVVVVGNTPMLALFSRRNSGLLLRSDHWTQEIDCNPLSIDPWRANWKVREDAVITLMQPLGGFVGSDLLAGVLATGTAEGSGPNLLIDFGTNSEIALWDGTTLRATSTAGGPAFEGTGIRCGMGAESGAIFRVTAGPGMESLLFDVIGGGEATGICGSGLVDWIARLRETGALNRGGRPERNRKDRDRMLNGPGTIALHPGDIDLVQRAKAAIAAGAKCLMGKAGIGAQDLQRICVSGAFGKTLDVEGAQSIGLLPPAPVHAVNLCGNTALTGCEQLLFDPASKATLGTLKKKSRLLNMAGTPEFEDLFLESLYLEPFQEQEVCASNSRQSPGHTGCSKGG